MVVVGRDLLVGVEHADLMGGWMRLTKMGFSWDLGKMEDGGQVLFGSTVGCWICHRICDGELGHAAGSVGYGRRSSMVQKGRAAGSGSDGSGPSAGGQMLDGFIRWSCSPT
ncbi:hypothetical protein ACLOJK_006885 [Asimina triloba]